MCQAFYHILRSIKTRFTQGRLFYTQGPFFCALGPLFCALVREEAIFAVCKRCANEGFACMCKEKKVFFTHAPSPSPRPVGLGRGFMLHFSTCSAPTARFGLLYRNILFQCSVRMYVCVHVWVCIIDI